VVLLCVNLFIIFFSLFYVFNITSSLYMCLMVVLLNLLLIPIWGIEGAAAASLLAMFSYNLIKYVYIKKRLGFDPFSWDIAKIVALGLLVYGTNHFLIHTFEPVLLDIFLRSGIIAHLYVLGLLELRDALDWALLV